MQKTILIVDDSAMIRHVVSKIVTECGYASVLAEDGKQGYDLARDHVPDLVIMDIEMPNMDGIEATRRITSDSTTAHIPVLIFTSLGSEDDLKRAEEAGCAGFLNKPVSKDELKAALANILDSE